MEEEAAGWGVGVDGALELNTLLDQIGQVLDAAVKAIQRPHNLYVAFAQRRDSGYPNLY